MSARIDPPKYSASEDRCVHDQLIVRGRSTCSICLGLPDLPAEVFDEDEQLPAGADRQPTPRGLS